jgi:ABC-type lipoprotein release transport system permease subunit
MAAIWLRFRTELRSRWRAWLALALLIGVAAGFVIAAAAGARRTDTAYERFLHDQRAFDAIVFPEFCPGPEDLAPDELPYECDVSAAAELPIVRESARIASISADVFTDDGRSLDPGGDPGYTGVGEVAVLGDPDGRFGTVMNRVRVIDGRLPDPTNPEEVTISAALARRTEVEVGDRLHTNRLGQSDGTRARLDFRVVGIEVAPFEVVPPSGVYIAVMHVTPAAVRNVQEHGSELEFGLAVRLVGGDAGANQLERQIDRHRIRASVVYRQADQAKAVERAVRPEAIALAVVALSAGLAAIAMFASVLGRHAWAASDGLAVLWALGLRRRQLFALTLVRGAAIGIAAVPVAAVVAVLLSSLTPIGLAREVEPSPGVALNSAVVGLGAASVSVIVVLLLLWPAWRIAHAASANRSAVLSARSALAARAARSPLSPATSTGVRMALDPGRGPTAVPIRSGFVGITAGVVALTAALGFGAGLTHLQETPRLLGYTWDSLVYVGTERPIETVSRRLARLAEVENTSVGTAPVYLRPFPDHPLLLGADRRPVELLAFEPGGVGLAVIDGRAPVGAHEILVGTETLDDLGLEIGDRIRAFGQVGDSERPDAYDETSVPMRIVGTGSLPLFTSAPDTAGRIGRGVAMTMDALRLLNPAFVADVVFVDLAPGTNVKQGIRALREEVRRLGGDGSSVFGDASPDLHNVLVITRVDALPVILAALMTVLSAALLAHVLVTSVRTRRSEFGILRALGFRRGDLRAVVTAHAATVAAIALVIGLPLGALLGIRIWETYAGTVGVVPEGVVDPLAIFGAVIVGLLTAGLVALWPAHAAARTQPAVVLRSE